VYPSDISREQFEPVRAQLENARKKKKIRPRTVDLYEVFYAILYLLKIGCRWQHAAERFPEKV
jgi:transposase